MVYEICNDSNVSVFIKKNKVDLAFVGYSCLEENAQVLCDELNVIQNKKNILMTTLEEIITEDLQQFEIFQKINEAIRQVKELDK